MAKMNKSVQAICIHCPYLTQEEAQNCWEQAKVITSKRNKKVRGNVYWSIVFRMARSMAEKIDELRRDADETEWVNKQRERSEGE